MQKKFTFRAFLKDDRTISFRADDNSSSHPIQMQREPP